jgi:CheY-like chemotaxis protein
MEIMSPLNASRYTLLIVDDEEILRDTIAFDFERKGFKVIAAGDGVAAFELYRQNKVDLIISDLRMPKGDGIGLLESVRKLPGGHGTPVIFITGFADSSDEERLQKGAFQVLAKPFDRKQLMSAALEALGIGG